MHLTVARCQRRDSQHQMETAATPDEPVPLKTVSNSYVCDGDIISATNGAVTSVDPLVQVSVNGNSGAANSTDTSLDMPRTTS